MPTRLKFKQLEPHRVPKSEVARDSRIDFNTGLSQDFVTSVLDRWRGQMANHKRQADDIPLSPRSLADEEPALAKPSLGSGLGPGPGLDPDRFKLLKK